MISSKNSKLDISVLITSISQREIAIETSNYYSKFCSEVIFVDEEYPHMTNKEIKELENMGIHYIAYTSDPKTTRLNSIYEKRLIAANQSNNEFLVHSNHDERYTESGICACLKELYTDRDLTFCIGQVVAIRKDKNKLHFTRSYENLSCYSNLNSAEQRIYYHSKLYAPLAHYSVWRKESYIYATEKTMLVHSAIPTQTIMEEIIFELAADLTGNSMAISELFWIRNRVNAPSNSDYEKGQQVFINIKRKLIKLFDNSNNLDIDLIMEGLWNHFTFVRPTFITQTIIFIKSNLRKIVKKKKIEDIRIILSQGKISYKKDDLANIFSSMRL